MNVETNENYFEGQPFIPITVGESVNQIRIERPNGFHAHQFLWVTQGEGVFGVDGDTLTLTQGDGFFSRMGVAHSYKSNGGDFNTMWVTFKGGEKLLDYHNVGDYFFFNTPHFLLYTTTRLMEILKHQHSPTILAAHGYLWAAELLDAVFKQPLSPSDEVTLFLENNYNIPLTLDFIAEKLGTNKFSLCRFYAKATGETVMKSLKKIRMQKAKSFLSYSHFTVEQIGTMCGFDSASYFIKTFREEQGTTPLQYRRDKWI